MELYHSPWEAYPFLSDAPDDLRCDFELLTDETASEKVNLVGNLCTGTDIMAAGITLPKAKVGDILAITKAGSYAYVLTPVQFSSQPAPGQFLLCADGSMIAE